MGKSRKKKEKKADFIKTKLKVGKTKPKPANYTDTSFKSRSNLSVEASLIAGINLPTQALDDVFLEGEARRSAAFEHQLAMTKHYAENQRKDAVSSLHSHLSQNLTGSSNSTSLSPLISHLAPLILDTSSQVRSALLELFEHLAPGVVPKEALQAHLPMLLLYIQSAMTHIQSDIRSQSTKFLAWILDVGGTEVVKASWTKILATYAVLLGWTTDGREKARIQLDRGSSMIGNVMVTNRHVSVLYLLLSRGISDVSASKPSRPKHLNYNAAKLTTLQHPLIECYLLPTHSAPFAHLNLFSSTTTDPQISSHDITSRRVQFSCNYLKPLLIYLHDLSAELVPSDLSRQPNQDVVDDLRITIVRILGLVMQAHVDVESDEQQTKAWEKDWRRCISKVSSLIEARSRREGSRRLAREWELTGIGNLL